MVRPAPIRVAGLLGLFLTLGAVAPTGRNALGQTPSPSALPANPPTGSLPLPLGTAGPIPSNVAPRKAEVEYTGGLLSVSANNSSLNQILHDVARLTGMKITGGITDDRVFGTYGPAPASQVLTSLLDGGSSNMMIVENAAGGPAELVLTPRIGGPTPPSPDSYSSQNRFNDDNQRNIPFRMRNRDQPQPAQATVPVAPAALPVLPPSNGGETSTPVGGGADIGSTPGAFKPAGETTPDQVVTPPPATVTTTDSTPTPRSPNGTLTPQDIYQMLIKQQQQKQAAAPATTPAPQ
jgi:hypothetical protein